MYGAAMFRGLEYSSVKGMSKTTPLGAVTLFVGPHRSGKSAAMEAARLAITGDCSFGSTNAKISELVQGKEAWASITGDEFSGSVSVKCGTRNSVSHEIVNVGGDELKPAVITASLPIDSKGFWSLNNEQRWEAVESVVGGFGIPQPPALEPIADEIKRIREASIAPPRYEGSRIDLLQDRLNEISAFISNAKEASKHNAYNKQLLENNRAELARLQDRHHTACLDEVAAQANIKNLTANLYEYRGLEEASKLQPLAGFGTVGEAWDDTKLLVSDRLRGIVDTAIGDSPIANPTTLKLACLLDDLDNEVRAIVTNYQNPNVDNSCTAAMQHILSSVGVNSREELVQKLDGANSDLLSCSKELLNLTHEISRVSQLIEKLESELGEEVGEDEIREKLNEAQAIRSDLAKATTWQAYIDGAEERAARLVELTARLESGKDAMLKWKQDRNNYILKSLGNVSANMSSVLVDMGWPSVELELVTSGKKQSLAMKLSTGASLDAMSGAEQVVYGSLFVHALQMLSRSQCPALFIEAAELNPQTLGVFVDSLAAHRQKGNVFIAHHTAPQTVSPSVTVVKV
jgi:hypothetical protein